MILGQWNDLNIQSIWANVELKSRAYQPVEAVGHLLRLQLAGSDFGTRPAVMLLMCLWRLFSLIKSFYPGYTDSHVCQVLMYSIGATFRRYMETPRVDVAALICPPGS